MIGIDDIRSAAARLEGVANRTPVMTSRTLDRLSGATVWIKAETFQRVGAFKFRGAYNFVSRLDPPSLALGVVAYSSGNHAQGVALAAQLLGAPAIIVMPENAPPAKLAATQGYGAQVVTYDPATADREAVATQIAEERGMTIVPPYEHPHIMAGQGTVATELIDEVGDIDVLLVPVGGGGLAAGCSTAAKAMVPGVEVYGVEPETADDTLRSLRAGKRVRIDVPSTIADGQLAQEPGRLTFQVNRRLLDGVVTVSDDEILDAMVFAFDRLKLVTEPSGATALAAALAAKIDLTGLRAGIVISGGNVGLDRFLTLLAGRGGGRPAPQRQASPARPVTPGPGSPRW